MLRPLLLGLALLFLAAAKGSETIYFFKKNLDFVCEINCFRLVFAESGSSSGSGGGDEDSGSGGDGDEDSGSGGGGVSGKASENSGEMAEMLGKMVRRQKIRMVFKATGNLLFAM